MKTTTTTSKCNDFPFHGNDGYTFFQIRKKPQTTTHLADLEQKATISNNQLRCCNYKEEDKEHEEMGRTFDDNAADIVDFLQWRWDGRWVINIMSEAETGGASKFT